MKALKKWLVQNKVIAALLVFLIVEGIIYLLFAHQLIEAIYKKESIDFLNNYFLGREQYPLSFYTNKAKKLFLTFNLLSLFLVQGSLLAFNLMAQNKNFFHFGITEIISFKTVVVKNKRAVFLLISLFFLFYCLYLFLGKSLVLNQKLYAFSFFGADVTDYVDDWTSIEWNLAHKGSHPLILLLTDFFGTFLYYLTKSKETSVVILNSFFGALAVFLSSIFFWIFTRKYVETAILTSVFGLSMSHLVFSTVPETYALAACSVITTYILFLVCLQNRKLLFGYWIIAGMFSFSVTITNFAQTLICFIVLVSVLRKKRIITTSWEYISAIVSFSFLLSIFQRVIFPGSQFFFLPSMLETELEPVNLKITLLKQPLVVIQELIKHFFLVNIVAPSPFTGIVDPENSSRLLLGFFDRYLNYNMIGFVGVALWICLFIIGFYKSFLSIKNKFITAISFSILFNMAMHSFFGAFEMFLYTCNFTFPILLLATGNSLIKKNYFKVGLTLLILLMGINNLLIMNKIIFI
jgi:hypothetical protein